MEQKILCAAFLEAVLRFYEDPANQAAFEKWRTGKGGNAHGQENSGSPAEGINHVPLSVAAPYLGVSPRQLSWLVAEGRQPFALIGGNIGTRQRYVRIYTEPLIALLSSEAYNF